METRHRMSGHGGRATISKSHIMIKRNPILILLICIIVKGPCFMSILRRYHSAGNIYFITNVTHDRRPILVNNAGLFWDSINSIKTRIDFELIAYVLIPDHFHILIDPKSANISHILQRLKMSFGVKYRIARGDDSGRVWQNRFWDHIIRNQEDMNRHIDYIHYNPVKHGLSKSPFDWKDSSISNYKEFYPTDWGENEPISFDDDFGE